MQAVLTLAQVAKRFDVSPGTVKRWIDRGYLHNVAPTVRYQSDIRVAESEIVEIEQLGQRVHGLARGKYPEVVFHLRRYKSLVRHWEDGEAD